LANDYLYAVANKYSDCTNLISGKVDLDCLIDKNLFQWHNMVLYLIIISYITILLYPVYQWFVNTVFIEKLNGKYNFNLEFPKEHIASMLLFSTIIIIAILEFKFNIYGLIIIFVIDFIFSYSMNKLEKYNQKKKEKIPKDLNIAKIKKTI